MELQELKIKKWRVWGACILLLFIIGEWIRTTFKVFTITFTDSYPILTVNPMVSHHPRYGWTGYVFKHFFIPHPYITLCLFSALLVCFLFFLFHFVKLALKGFVARMSPAGLLLPNNRLVPWKAIEAIEIVPQSSWLGDEQVLILLKDAKVVLSHFDLPCQEAYAVLVSYWQQYR
jgi:hypothetical protein